MDKKYYRTPRNLESPLPEANDGPQITMPDLSLTPQEILVKFAKGDTVPWQDENAEDYSKLEIEETYLKYQELASEMEQMKQRVSKYENAIREKTASDTFKEKVGLALKEELKKAKKTAQDETNAL